MKKFLASIAFIIAFTSYALYQQFGNATPLNTNPTVAVQQIADTTSAGNAAPPPTTDIQTTASTTASASQPSSPSQIVAVAPTPAPTPQGEYVDGTYTGPAANAFYGYVQVQATVSGGKLTDVQFLQYPSDRSTSRYINSQAMPLLTQEAITAQSANVDGVSGASDTSAAFEQSLSSALSQAKS